MDIDPSVSSSDFDTYHLVLESESGIAQSEGLFSSGKCK